MTARRSPQSERWDIDEFINWEDQQPERWELIDGKPWRMEMLEHRPQPAWDIDEFLNWEDQQPERWELIGGQPWRMMAGAPRLHSLLVGNIVAALRRQLRGGPCEVHSETFKFKTPRGLFYPDVLVHCGPIELDAKWTETPTLVVEVESIGTKTVDLGEKMEAYLATPGLWGYVIVGRKPRGMQLFRPEWGGVPIARALQAGESLKLEGLEAGLDFDEVFEGVPDTAL